MFLEREPNFKPEPRPIPAVVALVPFPKKDGMRIERHLVTNEKVEKN